MIKVQVQHHPTFFLSRLYVSVIDTFPHFAVNTRFPSKHASGFKMVNIFTLFLVSIQFVPREKNMNLSSWYVEAAIPELPSCCHRHMIFSKVWWVLVRETAQCLGPCLGAIRGVCRGAIRGVCPEVCPGETVAIWVGVHLVLWAFSAMVAQPRGRTAYHPLKPVFEFTS